jgi:multidrug efflux pump subunit AcrB
MTRQSAPGRFNLSAWAVSHQSLVIFLMLACVVLGAWSYKGLPRNEDPPFTIKTMVVSAAWPGASTTDTVNLLTDKLERKLQETPFLDTVESYTRPGESVVFVKLRDDTPPEKVEGVWYSVRKKIADLAPALPEGVQGPAFNDEFGDTFGVIYAVRGEGFSARALRDRVEAMRADLLRTPDVSKIELLGAQDEQILIEFSSRKLAALGVDAQQVLESLKAQNAVTPSGMLRTDQENVSLRVSGAFASENSLRQVNLRLGGRFVPLTDIATISRQAADPPAPTFRINGQPALGLAISMAPAGNVLAFGKAIQARMRAIEQDLPRGLEVTLVADQPRIVEEAVSGFTHVLLEAVAIVLAISFLSLGGRAGLVVTVSIPLVLAITFFGMHLAGIGLQRISLGALIIALGLLVDDAMITVEAMVSRLEAGWDLPRAASYAYQSTAFPMLTGTLVMIAGFIPVGLAASSAGEYCFSLFMVVLIALVASWIVAVLFSPLLGVWILPRTVKAKAHGEGRIMGAYGRVLASALRRPWATIGTACLLLALALLGSTRLENQFFPASDRPELLVSLSLPQNASRQASEQASRRLDAILKADPRVDHFSTYVGSGAIRFYLPMDVLLTNDNITQTVVVAKDLKARDGLRADLERVLERDFIGVIPRVSPLELGPPVGWPLKYRVTGPDPRRVREIAMVLANRVEADPQTRDVNLSAGEPQKSVVVEVDQNRARALGVSSEDVANALAALYSGMPLTSVRDGDHLVSVVVRGERVERSSLETVADLQIATPGGRAIPLRQIAAVGYGVEESIVWRRQRQAIITVQADVQKGREAASVARQLSSEVDRFAKALPAGYAVEQGGVVEESEKGSDSVMAQAPVMIMVMLTLLMIQLRSFSRVALAVLMAPFGLIGVVAIMLPTGTPMGFVAQLGVIALAGMIIRNAVILIEEADANVGRGDAPAAAISAAAKHRARPIVLTACAAILGMAPIARQVFWGPMAFAIIGGLAVATVLTLTLLPSALNLLLTREARRARSGQAG